MKYICVCFCVDPPPAFSKKGQSPWAFVLEFDTSSHWNFCLFFMTKVLQQSMGATSVQYSNLLIIPEILTELSSRPFQII